MGMTGYLLLRKDVEGGSESDNETILYETKVFIPFAWSILFRAQDLRQVRGDLVLAAQCASAARIARQRLGVLEPLVTPRLGRLLEAFVTSIENAREGWLILDAYRIDADENELLRPTQWFDEPKIDAAEDVFGGDDGVEVDDDDLLDVGDVERVAGWTVSGTDPPWFRDEDGYGEDEES